MSEQLLSPPRTPAAAGPLVPGRPPLRVGPLSTVRRPRAVVVPLLLAALALALGLASIVRGDLAVPVGTVLEVLTGGGERVERLVVLELRLPRALVGLLVGLALGAAGAITQAAARNPLASPDVLGVQAGAGVAAVLVIVASGAGAASGTLGAAGGALAWVGVPMAALAGGLLTAALVAVLAWGGHGPGRGASGAGGSSGLRLVLVGVGIGAFLSAVTSYLLVRAQVIDAASAMVWLTGSLNGRGLADAGPLAVAVVLAGGLALALARSHAALQLGDQPARALGVAVGRSRLLLVLAAVVLASAATAAAGPVLFIGLVAPQVAARLVRTAELPLVASALTGAVLLLAADLAGRTVLPVELPVGVLTAALGAPWLLWLLAQRTRRADA